MSDLMEMVIAAAKPVKLIYCDYIAELIRDLLREKQYSDEYIIAVGAVKWDLHPTEGYFLSPKKTLTVIDKNGTEYLITIEEKKQ